MPSIILSDNGVSSGSAGLKSSAGNDGVLVLQTSNGSGTATTALYINTSQNLGIGTSSPGYKLHVSGTGTGAYVRVSNTNGTYNAKFNVEDTGETTIGSHSSNNLWFLTGNTTRMTLDTSGNLGLGVTPSAWSGFTALQVSNAMSLWSSASGNAYLNNNTYYDGSARKYVFTGAASEYVQSGGSHAWKIAASGTAGNAISFTQAMTLDASGNLAIGATSAAAKLYLKQSDGTASSGFKVVRYNNDNQYLSLWANGGSRYIDSVGDSSVSSETVFRRSIDSGSNFTESARIDSSGNLLVGTTTAGGIGNTLYKFANGTYTVSNTSSTSLNQYIFQYNSTTVGTISTTTTATSYVTSSDYRLKENVAPMTGALGIVAQLKPVTYSWKVDGSDGQGFIAHELAEVVPDAVVGEKDAVETYTDEEGNEQTRPAYQGIDTSFLVATLTAAIQELKAIVDTQAAKITALENK